VRSVGKVNRRSFVCYAAIGVAKALLGESKPAISSARFTRIYLDKHTGDIHIVNANGKDVSVPKRPPFEAVRDPKLAENGLAAGWLVEMKTDANYPVPVGVAIFSEREGVKIFGSSQLPVIMCWEFFSNGKQLGFSSHGSHGADVERTTYELYDIQTGRLISDWDDQRSGAAPDWVNALDKLESSVSK